MEDLIGVINNSSRDHRIRIIDRKIIKLTGAAELCCFNPFQNVQIKKKISFSFIECGVILSEKDKTPQREILYRLRT
jgi:hypothetical protein